MQLSLEVFFSRPFLHLRLLDFNSSPPVVIESGIDLHISIAFGAHLNPIIYGPGLYTSYAENMSAIEAAWSFLAFLESSAEFIKTFKADFAQFLVFHSIGHIAACLSRRSLFLDIFFGLLNCLWAFHRSFTFRDDYNGWGIRSISNRQLLFLSFVRFLNG